MNKYYQQFISIMVVLGITLLTSRLIFNVFFQEQQQALAIQNATPSVTMFSLSPTSVSPADFLPLITINTPTPLFTLSNNPTSIKGQIIENHPTITQTISEPTKQTNYPFSVFIPAINLESAIVEVGYTYLGEKKTWEVPDYTVGTPREKIFNNTILLGHTGLYNSIFKNLKYLEPGNEIIVAQNNTQQTFQVKQNIVTDVFDLSYVTPQLQPTLTLITCEGEKRRIVIGLLE